MTDVRGKWALITGASRGIGRLIALEMAKRGCNLVLHSRQCSHCAELLEQVRALGVQAYAVEAELADAARQLTEAIMRNASVALDQAEHQRETARLSTRYQELQDKNEALKQEIREKISRRRRVDSFIRELKNLPQHTGQFDPVAFRILVERITVYEGKRVVVRFNDGSEIEA